MRFELAAQWTDDCQGKKDYDGPILSVSTRYWPRGGGFLAVYRQGDNVTFEQNDARPEIRPSATSALMLHYGEDGSEETIDLIEQSFEAETFEEVAAAVQTWAQEQMNRATRALFAEFGNPLEKP